MVFCLFDLWDLPSLVTDNQLCLYKNKLNEHFLFFTVIHVHVLSYSEGKNFVHVHVANF